MSSWLTCREIQECSTEIRGTADENHNSQQKYLSPSQLVHTLIATVPIEAFQVMFSITCS